MPNSIKTVIIDAEVTSRDLIKSYLQDLDELTVTGEFENLEEAGEHISTTKPQLIIADIPEVDNRLQERISGIVSEIKGVKILLTSYDTSPQTLIKALRAGAREFLTKPLIESAFKESIGKLTELIRGNIIDSSKCKVITTFSNKGGIGKTSIAVNLAVEIANITKEPVALIDLNMQIGDISTFLDLNPTFNTSYVLNLVNKKPENHESLFSTLEKYKNTSLYVLSDPPSLEQADIISDKEITSLINALKETFSYVIIDTTSAFDHKTLTALENSDLILFVTIATLPSIRNCQRCLQAFERLGYEKQKIKLLINRYMENDEITVEEVEKTLNHPVFYKIPNNYFTIVTAINKGIPVNEVNPSSNIAQSYKNLATRLADNYIYEQSKQRLVL